jgi:hypothetical protein
MCPRCKQEVWLEANGALCCRCKKETAFANRLNTDPRALALELKAQVDKLEERVDDLQDSLYEAGDW